MSAREVTGYMGRPIIVAPELHGLLSLRMLAVLGLDGPDGAPGPVLEGELLEQARQKGSGAGHNRRDAAAQGCDCSPR